MNTFCVAVSMMTRRQAKGDSPRVTDRQGRHHGPPKPSPTYRYIATVIDQDADRSPPATEPLSDCSPYPTWTRLRTFRSGATQLKYFSASCLLLCLIHTSTNTCRHTHTHRRSAWHCALPGGHTQNVQPSRDKLGRRLSHDMSY